MAASPVAWHGPPDTWAQQLWLVGLAVASPGLWSRGSVVGTGGPVAPRHGGSSSPRTELLSPAPAGGVLTAEPLVKPRNGILGRSLQCSMSVCRVQDTLLVPIFLK